MSHQRLSAELVGEGGTVLSLEANLFPPQSSKDNGKLLLCLPGGGASCGYFNLPEIHGTDHSFARQMAAKGYTIITMDHPGTGENPLPVGHPFLKPRRAADYIAAAFAQICDEYRLAQKQIIGVGHSMGGMVTTILQARHNLYTGIALLGSSARGLDWGTTEEEKQYIGKPEALERDLEDLVLKRYGAPFPGISGGPSGKSITFGGANEEATAALRENLAELFGAGGTTSMIRGSFAEETAAIDVPIFFAFGDHDIGAPPEEVPQDYPNAASIETHVLPDTGHNHFAFPTIDLLCKKLDQWAHNITG